MSFTEQLISYLLETDTIRNRYLTMTECKQALDFTNTYMFTLQSVISAYNSAYEVLTDRCIITLIKNEKML